MEQKIVTSDTRDEERGRSELENYHLYMVTLKPNFRSYKKRSEGQSTFMINVFGIFMKHFCYKFKMIDCGIEYDSNNICHVHVLLCSKIDFMKFSYDEISLTNIINFMKGIYVDFRICPMEDLDHLVAYINKGEKTNDIMCYYRNNYGFI